MKPALQGPRKDLKYISQHSPEINNDSCGPVVEIYFERVFLKHFFSRHFLKAARCGKLRLYVNFVI